MKYKKFINRLGLDKIQDILNNAHTEAVYYVDEWTNKFGGIHGFCTDKMIVGVHNPHTHYKLKDLRLTLDSIIANNS